MSNTNSPTLLPVNDVSDVLAILPSFLKPDDPAAVRDGILAGLTALCLSSQEWAQYAAAQADVLRATGVYQDVIGAEREVLRNGAADETYRANQLEPPAVVTAVAIVAAANAILAPFTSVQAVYCEDPDDREYVFDDGQGVGAGPSYNGAPQAYVYDDGSVPLSPDYLDRFYASEGFENGGLAIPNREPGDSRFFDDDVGRLFLLRVPDVSSIDAQDSPVYAEDQPNDFYVYATQGTPTTNAWTSYILNDTTTSATLYANLATAVTRIKGQSIRWILLVDANLGT
jgi:hypothetical protein